MSLENKIFKPKIPKDSAATAQGSENTKRRKKDNLSSDLVYYSYNKPGYKRPDCQEKDKNIDKDKLKTINNHIGAVSLKNEPALLSPRKRNKKTINKNNTFLYNKGLVASLGRLALIKCFNRYWSEYKFNRIDIRSPIGLGTL